MAASYNVVNDFAIVGWKGGVGTFNLGEQDLERVETWFHSFQRSKRTYPWCHYGEDSEEYATPREAWDVLCDASTEAREETSLYVPLGATQRLIEVNNDREDLWELSGYTSRGLVGYYGYGFCTTFRQNMHTCMDRTYVVLRGKVRAVETHLRFC